MSEHVVGLTLLTLSVSTGPTSSGAAQRVEPPPVSTEMLTESMPSATEERPKSARQGLPS